jgi:uncharacterized protein
MDFEKLKKDIQKYFPDIESHSFDHTERVYNLSLYIQKHEGGDLDVVKASALLHDIARENQSKGLCACHAEEGCKMAGEILKEYRFPDEKISKICEAIKGHRKSKGEKADSKEAMILQDADKLDALGAINIARIMLSSACGEYKRPLHINENLGPKSSAINFMLHQLDTQKPETFNTKTAQKLAKERYKFEELYVKTFLKEWKMELD